MERFRSSGTSGGLISSRTASAYVKERASEFLRAVGRADAFAIAHGKLTQNDVDALRQAVRAMVSDSWLASGAEPDVVRRFEAVSGATPPEVADRTLSDVLRARFPEETVRPELNSRWG